MDIHIYIGMLSPNSNFTYVGINYVERKFALCLMIYHEEGIIIEFKNNIFNVVLFCSSFQEITVLFIKKVQEN